MTPGRSSNSYDKPISSAERHRTAPMQNEGEDIEARDRRDVVSDNGHRYSILFYSTTQLPRSAQSNLLGAERATVKAWQQKMQRNVIICADVGGNTSALCRIHDFSGCIASSVGRRMEARSAHISEQRKASDAISPFRCATILCIYHTSRSGGRNRGQTDALEGRPSADGWQHRPRQGSRRRTRSCGIGYMVSMYCLGSPGVCIHGRGSQTKKSPQHNCVCVYMMMLVCGGEVSSERVA